MTSHMTRAYKRAVAPLRLAPGWSDPLFGPGGLLPQGGGSSGGQVGQTADATLPATAYISPLNPLRDGASAWDQPIILGGILVPCNHVVVDPDLARALKYDEKQGPGSEGSTTTYQGFGCVDFWIEFHFVNRIDWSYLAAAQWDDYSATVPNFIVSGAKSPPTPYEIQHPMVNEAEILSASITKRGVRHHIGAGHWMARWEFKEFRKPKKKSVTSTADKAKPDPADAKTPTVVDADDAEIVKQTDELKKVSEGGS